MGEGRLGSKERDFTSCKTGGYVGKGNQISEHVVFSNLQSGE